MKKTCPPNNTKGFSLVIVAVLVLVLLGAGVYLYSRGRLDFLSSRTAVPTDIPVAERINPEPLGPNTLTLGEVGPGKTVVVESVELAEDGYVVVVNDSGASAGVVMGKSALLKAGVHSQVVITLSTALVDGSVIFVRLQDKSGKDILGEAGTRIEVQKNIGDAMIYYNNEY